MRFRERLGRWLWPEGVKADEERSRLLSDISDLWWWGVSDETALAAAWLRNRSVWRGMTTEAMVAETAARMWPQYPLRGEIDQFRPWLQNLTPQQAKSYLRDERERIGGKSPHAERNTPAPPPPTDGEVK